MLKFFGAHVGGVFSLSLFSLSLSFCLFLPFSLSLELPPETPRPPNNSLRAQLARTTFLRRRCELRKDPPAEGIKRRWKTMKRQQPWKNLDPRAERIKRPRKIRKRHRKIRTMMRPMAKGKMMGPMAKG